MIRSPRRPHPGSWSGVGEPVKIPPLAQARHSLEDTLNGEVMPGVLAQLAAGHPIYYFCDDAGCHVEERPDGTVWRIELGRSGTVRYLDGGPILRNP